MKRDMILLLCWNAYGDFLNYNGMVRFLLDYFDKVCVRVDGFDGYLNDMFKDVSDRVEFVCSNAAMNMVMSNKRLPVLNAVQIVDFNETGVTSKTDSADLKEYVLPELYFNGKNQIVDALGISKEGRGLEIEYVDNASNFYINLGINPKTRYERFYYERNDEEEERISKEIKKQSGIDGEYIITSDTSSSGIKNEFKTGTIININYCTDKPLRISRLLEGAKEIHLIDNSNTLFLYYMCMSSLIKLNNVTVHIYSRNRFEYYYRMFMNPHAIGWKYIM